MPETALSNSRDLSDDDIVSKQLDPPLSLLARTGISFQGLERSAPLIVQRWIGKRPVKQAPEPRSHGDNE